MVSLFDRTMFYLHTKFYMCFPDFWYDFPRVPAYHWTRGKAFFSPKFFCAIYVDPRMGTVSLCVLGLPVCELVAVPARMRTGAPRMHTMVSFDRCT